MRHNGRSGDTQYGTVLVFRKGATPEEIAKALNQIKGVLDYVPARWGDIVREFDPQYGSPVFYIP